MAAVFAGRLYTRGCLRSQSAPAERVNFHSHFRPRVSIDRGPFTCTAQTDSNELVVTRKRGKSSITEGGENPTHFAAAADSHPPESFYNRGFRSLRGASPVQVRWKMFNMPGNHVADCVAKNLNIFVFADEGIPKAFQSLLRWGSPEFWAPFECSSFKSPGFSTF